LDVQARELQEKEALELRIRQQVLQNTLMSSPTAEQNDVVRFMQQQQPPQFQQYEYHSQSEPEKKRGRPYLMCVSLLAVVAAVVAALANLDIPSVARDTSTALPPCFLDNYEFADGANPPESPFKCDPSLERVECPGKCAGGHLFFCVGEPLTTAPDGSGCILNSSANTTLRYYADLLTNWTIQSYCSVEGHELAHKRSKAPVFPLAEGMDAELIALSGDFVLEDGGLVGLSDEYADTKLALPTMCWVSLFTLDLIKTIGSYTVHILRHTSSILFRVGKAYPLISVLCLAVVLVLVYTRRRSAQQSRLIADVAAIRHLAYQRMMQDASDEHVVLHLRDGIAMDAYPTSQRMRHYVIAKVWPRVVADVRLDNRVKKMHRSIEGKPRDVWQWVASQRTRSAVKFQQP